MMKAVIMAGGSGTRLWPQSRKNSPKQTKPFIDNKTLLQKTYERLRMKFDINNIWITTNQAQANIIEKQIPSLPKSQYSLEPAKMDTAAAIALVNIRLFKQDSESSMININSDAYIANENEFIACISTLEKYLENNPDYIAGIGIQPTYPETGYGYILQGDVLCNINNKKIYKIDKFVEKPDLKTALQYLQNGNYLWNPTLFCWKTQHMLELFEKFHPDFYKLLMQIYKGLGTQNETKIIEKIYPMLEKISIDYAIFEKAEKMAVLTGDFGWSDVGNWNTVKDIQSKTTTSNITKGDVLLIDSTDNLVISPKKLIAGIGLEKMIIVDTDDALLVCPKSQSQNIKKIVQQLTEEGREELL